MQIVNIKKNIFMIIQILQLENNKIISKQQILQLDFNYQIKQQYSNQIIICGYNQVINQNKNKNKNKNKSIILQLFTYSSKHLQFVQTLQSNNQIHHKQQQFNHHLKHIIKKTYSFIIKKQNKYFLIGIQTKQYVNMNDILLLSSIKQQNEMLYFYYNSYRDLQQQYENELGQKQKSNQMIELNNKIKQQQQSLNELSSELITQSINSTKLINSLKQQIIKLNIQNQKLKQNNNSNFNQQSNCQINLLSSKVINQISNSTIHKLNNQNNINRTIQIKNQFHPNQSSTILYNQIIKHKCPHYQRQCHVEAPCCKIFYPCKLCHDQKYQINQGCQTQRMAFQNVTNIKCLQCQQVQPPAQYCRNNECAIKFGDYTCLKCKLYQNNPQKINDIFHCDDCQMCRRGDKQSIFHCFECGFCRPLNHKCLKNAAQLSCPICFQILKYSTKLYVNLSCGHLIHWICYKSVDQVQCYYCEKLYNVKK